LVYLGVRNQEILKRWAWKLEERGIPFVVFREPDIGNEITALAAVTDDYRIFKSLQLI